MDRVDSSIFRKKETIFATTFATTERDSRLQLTVLKSVADGCLHLCAYDINALQDLHEIATSHDPCQIFCIGQRNSYSRLYITRQQFEQLVQAYNVFTRFWDFLLPFSFKTKESDLANAPFRFRQVESFKTSRAGSFECAYGFRYVELNNRSSATADNPDYDPWSLRQSAVYQRYDSHYDRVMFILITPSVCTLGNLEKAVKGCGRRSHKLNPFDFHRIIISTLHENWRLYIRSLEASMMRQSERVVLAQIQNEGVKLSPLTDFAVNFLDRQKLKTIEDKVLDLVIIFDSLHNTLSKLIKQCTLYCERNRCDHNCECSTIVEELEEQMNEVELNHKKVDVLHKRAQGTAQLLSDLLDYENAQIAHLNEVALNGLVNESREENSKMRILTERSTADAAAVRVLTVITLIYLPVTVVANLFSSQLILVSDSGVVSVAKQAWWFAVIAIPLTVFTFLLWQWWIARAEQTRILRTDRAMLEKDDSYSRRRTGMLDKLIRRRARRGEITGDDEAEAG